jgi:hypothetical protein
MGPYYIDDTVPIYASTFTYATGVPTDADADPTYRVYEMTTGAAILTGTMTLTDSANTDGFYAASFVASVANGFEVDKTYCVRAAASVSSVNQAGIVSVFVVRDVPATSVQADTIITDVTNVQTTVDTIQTEVEALPSGGTTAAEVWNYARPVLTAGRATTMGGMLGQNWAYFFNKNQIQSSVQTLFGDDSATVIVSGDLNATDTSANRSKME